MWPSQAATKKAKTLSKIYYSASKKTKELLGKTAKALICIAKSQLRAATQMAKSVSRQNVKRYKKLKEVGRKILRQAAGRISGTKVPGRILSYHEERAKALPKGKPGKPCEFGTKLSLSMSANGYITDHRLYDSNIADIATLKEILNKHGQTFGRDFAGAAADRAYYDEDLIPVLEKKHKIELAVPHKKTGTLRWDKTGKIYITKEQLLKLR